LRVCSLFSGIGGFELGLARAGFEIVMTCDNDPAAIAVLEKRFPDVPLRKNVETIKSLPKCDILTAGWPCQDLSQAGAMAGHEGARSGLVKNVFRLVERAKTKPSFILLENVAFSLHLHKGSAIREVTKNLEGLGYNWAYRVLDTQYFGLPQRRRRIFILGALGADPGAILFDGKSESQRDSNFGRVGFYWTEGNRGIGWTPDAVPPLKGGSGLSIPSPPAVWDKSTRSFFSPGITDAERLQGFRSGWTSPVTSIGLSDRVRWRLVGNAVSVPIARWIGKRLKTYREEVLDPRALPLSRSTRRANFGWGGPKLIAQAAYLPSEGPAKPKFSSISEFRFEDTSLLSNRAAAGFLGRLVESPLRVEEAFLRDLAAHCNRPDLIGDIAA
jgi:DNA (cytosine-5)-methyltransferase 1